MLSSWDAQQAFLTTTRLERFNRIREDNFLELAERAVVEFDM